MPRNAVIVAPVGTQAGKCQTKAIARPQSAKQMKHACTIIITVIIIMRPD
jgi:hypothetical protein